MKPPLSEPVQAAARVGAILESLGLRYSIGGSLASSFSGEPRSTLDVDIVVEMTDADVDRLAPLLKDEFYSDEQALRRAVRDRSTANLIEHRSSIKIDLFVAGGTILDEQLLQRRLAVRLGDPPVTLYIHTPEDTLLQKLRWFRLGGEVSDRQWRDVISIIRVQGQRLDRRYLKNGAARLGVEDLLTRAFQPHA